MKATSYQLPALMLLLALPLHAQARPSENAIVTQNIGPATIIVDYNRPSMRGRDSIFGAQVPWGHVWTPGANRATTIATNQNIRLGGHVLAPGRYGMWIRLTSANTWALHLHRDTTRWHLPAPPDSELVAAIPLTVRRTAESRETLSWDFDSIRAGSARLVMRWGDYHASLDVLVESAPRTAVEETIAARYLGTWTETNTRDTTRKRQVTVRYDQPSHQVMFDMSDAQFPEAVGARWGMLLVPRSQDIFILAYSINDELAHMSAPAEQSFVEFTVQNGRAVSYVRRNSEDRITSRGVRTP